MFPKRFTGLRARILPLALAALLLFIVFAPSLAEHNKSGSRGAAAHAQGEYREAIKYLTEAIDSGSMSRHHAVLALQMRADSYWKTGQKALAYADRGKISLLNGKYDAAISNFSKAISLKPKWPDLFYSRAEAYRKKGETALAEADSQMVDSFELKESSDVYLKRGLVFLRKKQNSKAVREISKAIRVSPNDYRLYFERAWAHYLSADYEKAISDYTVVIRNLPDTLAAYRERGSAYSYQGTYDKALADFNKVIEHSSEYARSKPGIFVDRARVYEKQGKYGKAIADYSKVIELAPGQSKHFLKRGKNYLKIQNYDRAIADFSKAIKIDPSIEKAYYHRGQAFQFGLRQFRRAIADYNKAIEIDPRSPPTYLNRGLAYSNLGQKRNAVEDYAAAIRLAPGFALAHNNRADALLELKQYGAALKSANEAVRLRPKSGLYIGTRGQVYEGLGDMKKACADWRKAAELGFNQPELKKKC